MKKKVFNDNLRAMLTVVFLVSLVAIIAIGAYSVANNIENQTDNIEISTISHLKTSDAVLYEKIKNIQRFVDILSMNEVLHSKLSEFSESNMESVNVSLNTMIESFEEIEGCVLVNSSGEAFIYNIPELKEENLLRLQVSCPGMSDKNGYLKWYNLEEDDMDSSVFNRYVFCASNIYYDAPVKLYLFVKRDTFKSIFDTSPYDSVIGVLNEDGRLVVSNDNSIFMSSYYSNGQNIIETYNSEQGIFDFTANDEDYVAVHYQSLLNEFKFVEIYSHDTFYKNCYKIIPFVLVIIVCVLGVMMLLYFVMFRRFLAPLKKLCYSMENFTDVTLNSPLKIIGNSEITMLTDGFNRMLSKINVIVDDIKTKEEEKKQAELLALKSQIRPHFIHNVVNSIRILALYNKQQKIADSLYNLSQLLKISFSSTEIYIPLSRDIEFIKGYVELMQICYEDAIDVTYHIESDAGECIIPNMIIQPIVENAICHGLAPKIAEQNNTIKLYIHACRKDDKLNVEVTDSGIGMTEEQIADIYTGGGTTLSGGVGLRNIIERIKLLYGEEYSMAIESKEGFFTSIHISLPVKNKEL